MELKDLIYKDECYKITGFCFDVFNTLGPGLREKNYHMALEEVFQSNHIPFQSQLYSPITINDKIIGKYFLDFLVFDKIVIELKSKDHFYKRDIAQLYSYLKHNNLELGILVNFTANGVIIKRILNII